MTRGDSQDEPRSIRPSQWPDGPLGADEEWPLDSSLDCRTVFTRAVHCPNPECNSYNLSHISKTRPLLGGKDGERTHQQHCLDCGFTFQVVTWRPVVRQAYWQIDEQQ